MDSAPQSDGDAAAAASSKRPRTPEAEAEAEAAAEVEDGGGGIENGEATTNLAKKRRKESSREAEMKKVAEIVLVLSAMQKMRGGRDPSPAEKALMAEARKKVVHLCEDLAPKDIFPKEAIGAVIEDLGLNRLKEQQRLGFRPPKMSIAEKVAHTKKRMEESKAFVAQAASYPSQRVQNTGAAGENRGTPPNVRVFTVDKAGHIPVSAGKFQSPAPAVHVSSAASTPLFRPPGTEVRPPVVSSPAPNHTGKDSPSMVPHRLDRAHLRPDGRPNGPSFVPHVPASFSADQHVVRTTLVPLQPQPTPWANVGTKNKVPDHLPVRVDSNATLTAPQKTAPAAVGQTPKPTVSQTTPVTLATMHHPVQGVQFVQASPVVNHHLEVSKLVQKLLDPKLPERPAWSPPSRDYMNRTVACQFCKAIINEVDNVLVCDACEKGFHLGCLQSYNAKGIPRGEWHCPRCLAMNRGKPFPPKYGRVTRNMSTPKVPSSTGGELSSEKKVKPVGNKANQPSTMTNGNPDFKIEPQTGKESSSEINLRHGSEVNESEMSTGSNKVDKPDSGKHPIDATGTAVEDSLLTSTGTSSGKAPQQEMKSEISPSKDRLVSETETRTPVIPQVSTTSDQTPTSSNQNDVDQERLTNGVELSVNQRGNCNGVVVCNKPYDDETHQKVALQENLAGQTVHDQAKELAESSENGLHNVDWIGDIDRVVDEKKFFQSCCINGVVYKVQDYALFHSGNGKLIPVKLQAMWEDNQTSSKWLLVHKCYFPDDLPEEVGRPGAPQINEVYESTHDSNVMAVSIQGLCEVLPFRKFGEEMEKNNQGSHANDRKRPVFIRNWFYDESRQAFCPNAS